MNKSAIKNFAIWARNKLIADITYKAGLLGISEKEIKEPLPQSTKDVQFFDIGTKEPYSISGIEIKQRDALAEKIRDKSLDSTLNTAFQAVVEEVAYTWFNRLIAVRFMEVNEYIPSRVRVISSESAGKDEPDLVTNPFDTDLEFTPYEKDRIMQLKQENQLDELFRLLFIKQCNALNAILPDLFEKTSDYTELLLNVAFTDKDGVVYHLVHDIPEEDFKIRTDADEEAIKRGELTEEEAPSGQVEIIGWLYQYYNTEPKDETFALLKKNVKITKERIPAATQLFTPDWIVRYMVENSLGRIFVEWSLKGLELSEAERREKEKNLADKMGWKYYLPEAEQEPAVRAELNSQLLIQYNDFHIEDLQVIDPCMGSGHILVYAFDILMQIYESCGYSQRDAAKCIIEKNILGLDIDNRAYQLAYFSLMMKARQYNRRILNGETKLQVYAIQESNGINRDQLQYFGTGMDGMQRNVAILQLQGLLDTFIDAKEYGSILNVDNYDWEVLRQFVDTLDLTGQLSFDAVGVEDTQAQLRLLVGIGAVLARKYDVVVTNPPYMGSSGMGTKLSEFNKRQYPDSKSDMFSVFIEKCSDLTKLMGLYAMITQPSFLFLSSFEKLRSKLISSNTISNLIHMGRGIFGIDFGSTAFVIKKKHIVNYTGGYFKLHERTFQYIDPDDIAKLYILSKGNTNIRYDFSQYNTKTDDITKDESLGKEIQLYYESKQENFSRIPGIPIAYWISTKILSAYDSGRLVGQIAQPKQGSTLGDNSSFLRLWFETEYGKHKWFKCMKGGDYRKWYGNMLHVLDWENNGYRIKSTGRATIRSEKLLFHKGITWSNITSGDSSFRYMEAGYFFESTGSVCFIQDKYIYYLLAFLNTPIVKVLSRIINPTLHLQSGDVAKLPLITIESEISGIDSLVNQNITMCRLEWDCFEISWDFIKHPLLRDTSSISKAFDQWQRFTDLQFNQLKANEEELNHIFIDIYGLQDELTPEVDDKDVSIRKADLGRDIRSFISYAVGCMLGRYSLDVDGLVYAGGRWDDSKYSTFIPDKDNIIPITDEEYFEDDIVGLFIAFVKKVYGAETLEENIDFIAKVLGNKGNTSREIIRNYFLKDFFKDHCKVYQKRPIYWLFDSGKANGFKALIYMHRYDENTIGNLRIDYLHKMQRVYEREIVRMQETIDNSNNTREVAAAEKRKDKLTKQLQETKEYDEKIAHLALARIVIDLDDGVKVNYEKVQTGTDGKKLEVLAKI